MPGFDQKSQVVVYGAGGHAKIVLATIEAEGRYEVVGLLDDDAAKYGQMVYGYRVTGGGDEWQALIDRGVSKAIVAIGNNRQRTGLARALTAQGFQLVRAIHPTATLLRGCSIGEGTVVLVNAFIGADSVVGKNAIVNVGVVVGHDSVVGSGAQLCPGVCLGGASEIGDCVFLGMGAVVLPQVKIGREAIVGANAVVVDDVPAYATVVGVPARIIK